MRIILFNILIVASVSMVSCSSIEKTRHKIHPNANTEQPKFSSQATYPQIEETYITGSRVSNQYVNIEKQTSKSAPQKTVAFNPPSDLFKDIIGYVVLCAIGAVLVNECILPHHLISIKNNDPSSVRINTYPY